MKQVKTFIRLIVDDDNDDEINEFLKNHKAIEINLKVIQGFTYTSNRNYATYTDETFRPSVITTVIYEVEQ